MWVYRIYTALALLGGHQSIPPAQSICLFFHYVFICSREIQGIKGGRRVTSVADRPTLLADEGTKAPGSEGQTSLEARQRV